MSNPLTLCQLNIENHQHLSVVIPFLEKTLPDVICVQELCEGDIPILEKVLDARCIFAPMSSRLRTGIREIEGIGIFSRLIVRNVSRQYYAGNFNASVNFDASSSQTKYRTQGYVLLQCDIEKEEKLFRIATTHFVWTPDGAASATQRRDMEKLIILLTGYKEFILCGDLNAPRGGEIFEMLSKRFKDNIPAEYTTSIDANLHRAGPLELMVDAIFSTSQYHVSDVKQIFNLSDHCAFTATIEKS